MVETYASLARNLLKNLGETLLDGKKNEIKVLCVPLARYVSELKKLSVLQPDVPEHSPYVQICLSEMLRLQGFEDEYFKINLAPVGQWNTIKSFLEINLIQDMAGDSALKTNETGLNESRDFGIFQNIMIGQYITVDDPEDPKKSITIPNIYADMSLAHECAVLSMIMMSFNNVDGITYEDLADPDFLRVPEKECGIPANVAETKSGYFNATVFEFIKMPVHMDSKREDKLFRGVKPREASAAIVAGSVLLHRVIENQCGMTELLAFKGITEKRGGGLNDSDQRNLEQAFKRWGLHGRLLSAFKIQMLRSKATTFEEFCESFGKNYPAE